MRTTLSILLPLLLAGFAGCGGSEMATFEHPDHGYTIGVPEGWESDPEGNDQLSLLNLMPEQTDLLMPPTVRVMSGRMVEQHRDTPLAEHARQMMARLAAASDSFVVLDSQQVHLAGREAIRYEFARTFSAEQFGQITRRTANTFVTTDSLLLIVSTTSGTGDWERFQPLFDRVRDSFTLD
jgi:hypothetical protein